ncbi:MAG: hypothetical protein U0797_21530 [Gemmataceae bacterium]
MQKLAGAVEEVAGRAGCKPDEVARARVGAPGRGEEAPAQAEASADLNCRRRRLFVQAVEVNGRR